MSSPADAGVVEAIALLARREVSSRELVEACLARIRECDGTHSHEGDPSSINAWVRVYEEDALAGADRADARLAAGDAPPLCGVPVGLKDLYAVAGKPLTASSRLLDEVPTRSSDAWTRLEAAGMVLLEPTVPLVARPRGDGYDEAFTDVAEISLTHYWNWTGLPVAALPSGVGRRSGLPVGVSLIGPARSDWDLLAAGALLQSRLGIVRVE